MHWLDVSVPLRWPMPVYEGDPAPRFERIQQMAKGGVCNLTKLDFGLHTGTHIDAPLHFIDGGAGAEETPLDVVMGAAVVADVTGLRGNITEDVVAGLSIPRRTARLLFKTRNSKLWESDRFSADFTAITEEGAEALVRRGVQLVGIDYLSIAPFGDPAPTHLALLGAGVVVLEGLDLRRVAGGEYELRCLPLLIPGADGAPARTLLGQ